MIVVVEVPVPIITVPITITVHYPNVLISYAIKGIVPISDLLIEDCIAPSQKFYFFDYGSLSPLSRGIRLLTITVIYV